MEKDPNHQAIARVALKLQARIQKHLLNFPLAITNQGQYRYRPGYSISIKPWSNSKAFIDTEKHGIEL